MDKKKFDYKKITFKEMVDWFEENVETLRKDKPKDVEVFADNLISDKGGKPTLKLKKPFYELAKDYVEFENVPTKKKKKDVYLEKAKELKAKYGSKSATE